MIALAVRALAVAALAAAAAGQTVYPAGATVIVPPGPIAPVPFTPGNIVVARLGFWNGTGWAPLSTIGGGARAAPYYLDELKCVGVDATGARNAYPGGTPCTTVQTIGLPTTTIYGPGGVVTQYTCTGTYDFVEGQLTLSENSQFLILSCYDTTVNANELRQGNRVACLIGWDASIDCTTAIPWGPNPGGALSTNYWSAYSPNGCDVYMAGNGGYLANGGIQYTYRGQSGKSWPILAPTTSYNSVISVSSYGGQMYAMVGTGWSSSPPAMPRGVMLVGGKVSGPNVAAWTAIGAYPRVAGSTSLTFAPGLQTSCLDAQGNILPAGTPCVYGDACELMPLSFTVINQRPDGTPITAWMTTLNYNSTATGNGCRNNNNPAELIRFDYTDAAGWTASQALYSPTFDSAKDFAYMPNVPADANANVLGVSGQNVGVSYNLYTVDAVSYSPNNAGLGMGGKQTPSLYVYNSQVSPASNLNKMSFQAQTPSPWGGSLTAAGAYYGKAVENTPTGTGVFLGCPAFSAPPPPPPYTPTNSDGTSTIVAPPAAPANPAFASLIAPPPAGTAPRPFTLGNIAVMRLGIYNSSGAWSPLSVIGGPRQATPIYIDELQCVNVDGNGRNSYPGGLPCKTVQTIPLPTVTTTANGVTQFACLGNYDFVEGAMQLSEDGRFLIVSCYDTPPGNTETRQGNRVACIIDWTGNVDCSTSISWGNGLSKNYWSAYTPNGCDIYMSGDSGFQAKGGIQYTYRGLSGQSWPILAPSSSYNSVISTSSYGGQLYAMVGTGWSSSPPAMPRGVMAVGGKNAGSTVAAWTAVGAYPRAPGSATMVFVAGLQTSCLDFQGRPTPTCTFGDACELMPLSWTVTSQDPATGAPITGFMTTLNYNSTASGNRCPNNNNPAEVVRFDNVQGSGWTSSLALFTPSFDSAKDFAYLPSVPADPSATVLGATNVNVAASSSIFTVDAVSYSANAAGSGIGGKAVPSLYVWNSQVSPGNLNRMTVQPQTPAWGGDLNLPGVYYAKAVDNVPVSAGSAFFAGCPPFTAPTSAGTSASGADAGAASAAASIAAAGAATLLAAARA